MSLNHIVLMGRLTADPELKTTQSGLSVTSFTVACDRSYGKDKQADFIPCTAWRKTAEFVTKYFAKGSMIAVEGSLQSRKYADKDGKNHVAYDVIVDHVHFAGGKSDAASHGGAAPAPAAPAAAEPAAAEPYMEVPGDAGDLPF